MSKEAIQKAALELFEKISYVKTSIADIASAAGIGKGSVYLSFKSKEEILFSILDEELDGVREETERFFLDPSVSLEAKLDRHTALLIEKHFRIRDLMFGSFENVEGRELQDVYRKFSVYIERVCQHLSHILSLHGYRPGPALSAALTEYILSQSGRIVIVILSHDWNARDEVYRLMPSWSRRIFPALVPKE